jgi:hypothetical protein
MRPPAWRPGARGRWPPLRTPAGQRRRRSPGRPARPTIAARVVKSGHLAAAGRGRSLPAPARPMGAPSAMTLPIGSIGPRPSRNADVLPKLGNSNGPLSTPTPSETRPVSTSYLAIFAGCLLRLFACASPGRINVALTPSRSLGRVPILIMNIRGRFGAHALIPPRPLQSDWRHLPPQRFGYGIYTGAR